MYRTVSLKNIYILDYLEENGLPVNNNIDLFYPFQWYVLKGVSIKI